MKKSITLTLLALMSIVGAHASQQIGDLYYNLDDDNLTASVTYSDEKYTGDIVIPVSVTYNNNTYAVTTIGGEAFYCCRELTSVTIPNSVTSIEYSAFQNCSALTSLNIPSSLTSISSNALQGCSGLTAISVETGNSIYDSRDNCNALIETASNTLLLGCKNTIIPNTVTTIEGNAFYNCQGLTSISIPNGVTTIKGSAFENCSALTSLNIPSSVTSIQASAFRGCTALASISVETGNSIYDSRDNCNAIIQTASNTLILGCKNSTIPNTVTTIGECAFSDCTELESITIPGSVTEIQSRAFENCAALLSLTIPETVTNIDTQAFLYVPNIIYNGTNSNAPWGAKSMNGTIDGYFVYDDDTKTTLLVCSSLAEGSITVPNTVTNIDADAFEYCEKITELTILGSITSIGNYAFYQSKITSITLPNTLTTIGEDAFGECSLLTSFTIPSSVTSIGDYAFEYCTGLTEITVEAVTPPTITYSTFDEVDHTIPLYVPDQSVNDYKAADYWSEFTNILPISQSPATAIDNIYSDNNGNNTTNTTNTTSTTPTKIFRNNQLLILHNNHTYTLTGTIVE